MTTTTTTSRLSTLLDPDARATVLGFKVQRENIHNVFLPFTDEIDIESDQLWTRIKTNLCREILLCRKESIFWIEEIMSYLDAYEFKFTKEDHICCVQLLYEYLFIPDLNLTTADSVIKVLTHLLSKPSLLSREDLSLDWKKPYKFSQDIFHSKATLIGLRSIPAGLQTSFEKLLEGIRHYYVIGATEEMLAEWMPKLCPFSPSEYEKISWYFRYFLPTSLPVEYASQSWKLWFDRAMELTLEGLAQKDSTGHLWSLLGRLATEMAGHIDWDPYMHSVFNSFFLEGIVASETVVYLADIIIYSLTTSNNRIWSYLQQFIKIWIQFRTEDEHYDPDSDESDMDVVHALCLEFIRRLRRERVSTSSSSSWLPQIPESHRLKDSDCHRFATLMLTIVENNVFSENHEIQLSSLRCLRCVSLICPEAVFSPILKRFSTSFETTDKVYRLIGSMKAMTAIAKSAIEQLSTSENGIKTILKILDSSLECIGVNDNEKTDTALKLIRTFAALMPFTDQVPKWLESTAEKKHINVSSNLNTLCPFEAFVLKFVDKVCSIVRNEGPVPWMNLEGSQFEMKLSPEKSQIVREIQDTLTLILFQCSETIFDKALEQTYSFLCGSIYEFCSETLPKLVWAFVQVNPVKAFERFLPYFHNQIVSLTMDKQPNAKIPDRKLITCFAVVDALSTCPTSYLLKHERQMFEILDLGFKLKNHLEYTAVSNIVNTILTSATTIHTNSYKAFDEKMSEGIGWAKSVPLASMKVDWQVPEENDFKLCQRLLDAFLRPQMNLLLSWDEDEVDLSKDECRKVLTIVRDCVRGVINGLPIYPEVNESNADNDSWVRFPAGVPRRVTFSDGTNVRQCVLQCLKRSLAKVLLLRDDDTKSINIITECIAGAAKVAGLKSNETDWLPRCLKEIKVNISDQSKTIKEQPRLIHMYNIIMASQFRDKTQVVRFSEFEKEICDILLPLSVNHYDYIQDFAIQVLKYLTCGKEEGQLFMVSKLVEFLKRDELTDEELCGVLRTFDAVSDLGSIDDFSAVSQFWLSLLTSPFSGDKKVLSALKEMTSKPEYMDFQRLTIRFQPNDETLKAAKDWSLKKNLLPVNNGFVNGSKLEAVVKENVRLYVNFVKQLVSAIESRKLHWMYEHIAFTLLVYLVRYDQKYPVEGTILLLNGLIHDVLNIRKICIAAIGLLLQQEKRPSLKVRLDPLSEEVKSKQWMHFLPGVDYMDPVVRAKTVFVDKLHWGFSSWPKDGIEVYDTEDKQPKLNRKPKELNPTERAIYEFFTNSNNIQGVLELFALEENKLGKEFDLTKFTMYKRLFRNYGICLLDIFKKPLQRLMKSVDEKEQRCAYELVAGLLRGSKLWPLADQRQLRHWLEPLLRDTLAGIAPDTIDGWNYTFGVIFRLIDMRRYSWLVSLITEEDSPEKHKSMLHHQSLLMYLYNAVGAMSWKGTYFNESILEKHLRAKICLGFTELSGLVGNVLQLIFSLDVKITCRTNALQHVLHRGDVLGQLLSDANSYYLEGDESKRVIGTSSVKVMTEWITHAANHGIFSLPLDFYQFIPVLCEAKNDSKDESLAAEAGETLEQMASSMAHDVNTMKAVLDICRKTLERKSWKARNTLAKFVRLFVETFPFIIPSNTESLKSLVMTIVEDRHPEVRESGGRIIKACIEASLVLVTKELVEQFKRKSVGTKKRKADERDSGVVRDSVKHGAIICLCGIVDAHPYDVPPYLPDILTFLVERLVEPQHIATTIKSTLESFRETHYYNWTEHKEKFTEKQLEALNDLLISPYYYA